jgi:competence ComEA-like helix-hairpin-helix protein
VQGSAQHAALGLIVAGLALAALAAQRTVPPPAAPVAVFPRPTTPKPELRALRDGQRLDINRASAEELTLIPGVGPKLAARIVEERSRRGRFERLEDLRAVRGLGPKVWLRVEPFVEVDQVSNRKDNVTPACRYTGSSSIAVNKTTGFTCTPTVSSRDTR